jgi:hypothetical protein
VVVASASEESVKYDAALHLSFPTAVEGKIRIIRLVILSICWEVMIQKQLHGLQS